MLTHHSHHSTIIPSPPSRHRQSRHHRPITAVTVITVIRSPSSHPPTAVILNEVKDPCISLLFFALVMRGEPKEQHGKSK